MPALDRKLRAESGWRSLCPDRARATSLEALHRWAAGVAPGQSVALSEALERLALAQHEHYPENVLWDQDALAGALVEAATEDRLPLAVEQFDRLFRLFGVNTVIRFRYVHDFMYGYDWLKWVRRGQGPSSVPPFAPEFLSAVERRGLELLELISQNDERYPRLEGGAPRNPFPFSREPDDELRLHRDLAERDLIPVKAWRVDAPAQWHRPLAELRIERAEALGLSLPE